MIERVNQIQVRRWHHLMNDSCLKQVPVNRKEELLYLPSYFRSNTFSFSIFQTLRQRSVVYFCNDVIKRDYSICFSFHTG